ncbi:MAG TPA: DUF2157 domain-containing protein [Candidatus Competibacteraceae bacterium]|nr:DUF2157 domain-containing protein [Candidatus Competibacteraceae bacterium]
MHITRLDLDAAAHRGLLSPEQSEALWQFLLSLNRDRPGFRMTHILYYLGGMLSISALSLFVPLAWDLMGDGGLVLVSLSYMLLGVALTEWLLGRQLRIPAGLTAALVVALTPLLAYAVQRLLGLWDDGMEYRDTTYSSPGAGCSWSSPRWWSARPCCGATGCRFCSCRWR